MQRLRASSLCLWLGALVFESGVFCQTYVQITEFVDGQIARKTFPTSINNQGEIVGYWQEGFTLRGFVRAAGGTITAFDVPGPLVSTLPQSINDAGAITGYFQGPANPGLGSVGFVRDPEGNFTSFAPPGGISTQPRSINAGGAITGYYNESNLVVHGFVREPNGTITAFDPPGSTSTHAVSINANGAIAGYFQDANGTHGFLRRAGGAIVSFDPPGSTGTYAVAINDAAVITGTYTTPSGRTLGFVRQRNGTLVTFDAPASTFVGPNSINDEGAITGTYFDTSSSHAFVRSPEGMITSFDALNVCYPGGARATSINKGGVITGWCYLVVTSGADPGGFARYP
jgi:hypothetical protein